MAYHARTNLTFIDLFAGIGGMRLGFQRHTSQCVFSCEWDDSAQKTYFENFAEFPKGDITKIRSSDIPDHNILLAGFPCQPFSISGVSKKKSLGRPHGFEDKTQGTLFFEVARVIRDKRPEAFILENVKNLIGHDKGNTFAIILETLQRELAYDVHVELVDAQYFVPQHRERVFIVGFREPRPFKLILPEKRNLFLKDILQPAVPDKYVLSDKLWNYLQAYAAKHKAAGNGFGFGLAELSGITRTLSARYYKDGSEILIPRGRTQNPRRLTPRECARLMGFPDSFRIVVSDTQAYKQFGNSVVVPAVRAVADAVYRALKLKPKYSMNLFDEILINGRVFKGQAKRRDVANQSAQFQN